MARDPSYQVQVTATPRGEECAAALGLFYNTDNWLFAELKGGQLRVYGPRQTLTTRPWKATTVHLRIVNRRNRVEFLAGENGRAWQSLAADVDTSRFSTNTLHGFQALRPAPAASGAADARFADFRYRAL